MVVKQKISTKKNGHFISTGRFVFLISCSAKWYPIFKIILGPGTVKQGKEWILSEQDQTDMIGGDTCCWVGWDFPKDVLWLVWISWTTWCHSHLKSYQDQTFHLGAIFSSLQIHGRFFQNWNLSIVLDGWYGIHSWNKIAWSLWLKRPCLGWFLTPQNHWRWFLFQLSHLGWGDFRTKKIPGHFYNVNSLERFPPQKFVGCQVPTLPFPNKTHQDCSMHGAAGGPKPWTRRTTGASGTTRAGHGAGHGAGGAASGATRRPSWISNGRYLQDMGVFNESQSCL